MNSLPAAAPVVQQFFHNLSAWPECVALQDHSEQISYAELAAKADQLSARLLYQPEQLVAVSTTRSTDLIVAMLALLKCGKAYLPLDPTYPVHWLKQVVQEAGVTKAIYPPAEKDLFENQLQLQPFPEVAPPASPLPEPWQLAYVLYTSGAAGMPKGVCMGHAATDNLIRWQNQQSHCGKGSRTLGFSPLHSEVSFQEIFATLTTGGTLVLAAEEQRLNPSALLQFIATQQINRIFLPLVALQLLAAAGITQQLFPEGLQEVITAGEPLKMTPALRSFFFALPNCRLYKQYGSAECPVVSQQTLSGDSMTWPDLLPIGPPVSHMSIYLLDTNRRMASPGTAGELCIGGSCLAEGYLNQPVLTAEKFINWQHPTVGLLRLYKTGDLARQLPDGLFEFLGRLDDQVKIRGYRVEPFEIETAISRLPGVQQAVVVADRTIPEQLRLVAYVQSENAIPEQQLREQLAALLPEYLIPSAFLTVSSFPQTPDGKIDKKALPDSSFQHALPGKAPQEIAIIGMACRFPGAATPEAFWNLLAEGRESIRFFSPPMPEPLADPSKEETLYVPAKGMLDDVQYFDADFFGISAALAEIMDPQQRIFLELAYEALETTGYLAGRFSGTVGVFAGCNHITYYLNNVLSYPEKIRSIGPFQVNTASDKDYIASRTAFQLNLKGPAVSISTACSTALTAVAQAVESIRAGHCSIALAGAASIASPELSGHLYQKGDLLSKDGHTRAFDAAASGTVFSDGAGIVVLKSLAAAEKDGDRIYAVIRGIGISSDGGEKGSFTAPSASGQAAAIAMALQDGHIDPATISYIEAHGVGTLAGDSIEIEGLKMAFGQTAAKQYCAIGSVKTNLGHLNHAAGAAGLIKTILAMQHDLLPASLHFEHPNPAIDFSNSPFYVNTQRQPWQAAIKRAGISSFGMGGTNVHLIIENHPHRQQQAQPDQREWQLITWSARSAKASTAFGQKLSGYMAAHPAVSLAAVAATLQTTRQDFAFKQYLVARDHQGFQAAYQHLLLAPPETPANNPVPHVAFLFPGLELPYASTGRELSRHFPVFRQALDQCRSILLSQTGEDILANWFSHKPDDTTGFPTPLYAQPIAFSISYALAKLWMSFGIRPQVLLGYDTGEWVAAHLAGIFSLKEALQLVVASSRLISQLPPGAMLAVRIPEDQVGSLLEEGVEHALSNSPNNHILSGSPEKIRQVTEKIRQMGLPHAPVRTQLALHTAMMEAVSAPLQALMADMELKPPHIPLISCFTGTYLKDEEAVSPAYWAGQARATVRFSQAAAFAIREIGPVFLEAGPGNILSAYIRQQHKNSRCVDSIHFNLPETPQLLQSLGRVWQQGIRPDWTALYAPTLPRLHNLPNYAFQRKKHWLEPLQPAAIEQPLVKAAPADTETPAPDPGSTPVNPVSRKVLLTEKIKRLLETALGIHLGPADEHLHFPELGIDSLLLTQLSFHLKKEFSMQLSFRQLSEEYTTVRQLANYLDKVIPPGLFMTPLPPAATLPATGAITDTAATGTLDQITQQLLVLTQKIQAFHTGKTSPAGAVVPALPPTAQPVVAAATAAGFKKPFGATTRIETKKTVLTDQQKKFIADFTLAYSHKTAKSKAYTQQHRARMADPRAVTGFKPVFKEMGYPIVIHSSKGCRLRDLDGNEYIDALNGFGSNLLGYQPDLITHALKQQIDRGYEIGPQHELAGPVCELICELTRSDRAALCNTGSEAVLGAMRMARAVTGRSLIVAFSGAYHGINDEALVRGTLKQQTFPTAPGILPEAVRNMLILEYGTEESLQIIRERAFELAAVLVEPVQRRRPEFQPIDFLKQVRSLTTRSGAALIFDEVITGFRMHPGGAQALFGIRADLSTYGKVIGGGLPIAAIAGEKRFMDTLDGGFWQFGDDSLPEEGLTHFAGTFVRHPLALAAAKASLEYLKTKGPALQAKLNEKTTLLTSGLNAFCTEQGIPVDAVHFGSLWKIRFREEHPYRELLFAMMRFKGIHIWDDQSCFLTEAHQQQEIDQLIRSFRESATALMDAGLLQAGRETVQTGPAENEPPVRGAKLGFDQDGNPGWFVHDLTRQGKYLKIEV